jgi:hypothetical protein
MGTFARTDVGDGFVSRPRWNVSGHGDEVLHGTIILG